MKYFLDKLLSFPETSLLLILSILISSYVQNSLNLYKSLILLILISISFEYVITKVFKITTKVNINNFSFAFLLFLITNTQTELFLAIFTLLLAHFLYHIEKYNNFAILNNITLSILIFSLFGLKINWWGMNTSLILIALVILAGIITNYIRNNLWLIFLFATSVVTFNFIFTFNPLYSIKQIFVPGFIFFTFFILTLNINTFLYNKNIKLIYILLTALLSVIIPKIGFFTDPLITSIVLTEILLFSITKLKRDHSSV